VCFEAGVDADELEGWTDTILTDKDEYGITDPKELAAIRDMQARWFRERVAVLSECVRRCNKD
jgi:hypothetical protein